MMIKKFLYFIKIIVNKIIIGPFKYGKGNDYDASKYWHDRFSKYSFSLKGSGVERLSEKENEDMYLEFSKTLMDICKKQNIDFTNINILEIGCGNGYWTQFLQDLGIKKYVGVDITDVLFPVLKKRYPNFKFLKKDITIDTIDGRFDLIFMIDIILHITTESKFSSTMENIKNCLSEGGVCIISNIMNTHKKRFFYLQDWSIKDVKQRFPGYIFSKPYPFRETYILTIRKPPS